ncbi:LAS superfamily LD-carboxypeptidase LdcB [Lewinella marina]|uniref:Peptidase M15 n=1 Tax=Neolewinella marina TaxID=438751 RepID=A0A2G0CG81_9BACT|nr:M15 family metallopeptidase [Neolewinella marina]NJB86619.1 LAS superfamily LD-carboxypeptidase LdcB [Neolewinella marina]PHK98930.1 peptidase M15 [Neolewinella marina]
MKHLFLSLTVIAALGCGTGEALPPETMDKGPAVVDSTEQGITAPAPAPSLSDSIGGIPTYEYLTGKFDPAAHPDFVKVADRYTDGDPYLLHRETYTAFERMHAAALADGVRLRIVSATRNFARQKQIWEAKWNGQRLLEGKEKADEVYPDPADRARAILRYSSMPGTSRHHWGTDIDLNALNNDYFRQGEGQKIYDWLTTHGGEYGFCQPYTAKGPERPNGYEEERWHWSYRPLATRLTDYAANELQDTDISGFAGAEAAPRIGVVENYVLGVNSDCKK